MELLSSGNKEIDWSALPGLVLSLVADKLDHVTEFARFGVVCTSWNAIYKDIRDSTFRDILQEPLLLMLPDVNDKKGRTLYSLNQKKVYKNFRLSVPHDEICVGSSHGWLAMVSKNFQLRLLNPLLSENDEIKLPPLPDSGNSARVNGYDITYVTKVVISGDPLSNPNYAVMAIHGSALNISFYKASNKEWTCLDSSISIGDVIYIDSDQKFYAFSNHTQEIFAYDLTGDSSTETPKQDETYFANYLVKSGSDMLQVRRDYYYGLKPGITMDDFQADDDELDFDNYHDSDRYYTDIILVYKFDRNKRKWIEVKNLDGRILFVGHNSSLSLSASVMPGCEPNCVYFTDDNHDGCFRKLGAHDSGFFNLEVGRVQFFNVENDGSIKLCNLEDGGSIPGLKFEMGCAVPIFIQPSPSCSLS